MNIMAIDIGTYSVKFIEATVDRKKLIYHAHHETVLSEYEHLLSETFSIFDLQHKIIREFLERRQWHGKIIFQFPSLIQTTRFFTFPVTSKKKVHMMLPFQLDRDLPFPAQDCHVATQYLKQKKSTYTIVSIAQKEKFENFFKSLKNNHILPDVLTTEVSVFQSFITSKYKDGDFCILDIGHETTKAYFVHNRKITSNHTSHVAGKVIDEIIAETYQISLNEAVRYKQESGFFLTEKQYSEVNQEQKEFAKLMKRIMLPLLGDIKKWELGHRVNFGRPIERIFLCGGTCNIKNISNFFTQNLSIKTEPFQFQDYLSLGEVRIPQKEMANFSLAQLMGQGLSDKVPPLNLRTGPYAGQNQTHLPLHSASFLAVRVAAVSLVLCLMLLMERLFIHKNIKAADLKIATFLKDPDLGIPPRDRQQFKKRPKIVLDKIKAKNKVLEKELNSLQEFSQINALLPLFDLNKALSANDKIILTHFEGLSHEARATFKSPEATEINKLKNQLEMASLEKAQIIHKANSDTLTLNFGK